MEIDDAAAAGELSHGGDQVDPHVTRLQQELRQFVGPELLPLAQPETVRVECGGGGERVDQGARRDHDDGRSRVAQRPQRKDALARHSEMRRQLLVRVGLERWEQAHRQCRTVTGRRREGEVGTELLRLSLTRNEQDHLAARRLFDETGDENSGGRRVQPGDREAAPSLPPRLVEGRPQLAVAPREIEE